MIKHNIWVVLIVFMILLTTMVIWQGMEKGGEQEVSPTSTSSLLLPQLDVGKMVAFTLQRTDGNETLILERGESGQWVLKQPPAEITDVPTIEANFSQLASMRILSTPMLTSGLEDLGLMPPVYRILIQNQDGTQLLFNIGNETPTGSGYYVLTPDRRIVVVSKFALDTIIAMLNQPPMLTPTPTLTPTIELTEQPESTPTETSSAETPTPEITPTP